VVSRVYERLEHKMTVHFFWGEATIEIDCEESDPNLPGPRGSDLRDRIRSNPDWDNIAVIFHTGSERHPNWGAECHAFLTYPIEGSDLVFTITGCNTRRQRSTGSLKTSEQRINSKTPSSAEPSAV
jgi:hypothetical protein